MLKIPKLEEFTVEELQEQLSDKKIDKDFLIEYIVKRDKVYNQLIDEIEKVQLNNQQLKEQLQQRDKVIEEASKKLEHIIDYLEKKDMFHNYESELLAILNKYKDKDEV